MKIAHVVTYVSPDGAFGGPARVALGQASALAERGHDVTVFAGSPRKYAGVTKQDGYLLKTFPAQRLMPGAGFSSMAAPRLNGSLRRSISEFDVVHVHMGRDLVTLPAALIARTEQKPYVVQPHGMIGASRHPLARPLDIAFTRRIIRSAGSVLVLTDEEAADMLSITKTSLTKITNGVKVSPLPDYRGRDNVVLFLARLQDRKRPVAFVQMAAILVREFPQLSFVLAGPDEGAADAVEANIAELGISQRVRWLGPVAPAETDALLASASVYVLPSFGEVFPMSVLESFRAGTPVVTTDSLGIATKCTDYSAALITDGSPEELAEAVSAILRDEGLAESLRAGARRYLTEELDVSLVAERLESIYLEKVA